MLRRAKSFIHRSRHEEERRKTQELDLSETGHLRRTTAIDGDVLEKQRTLRVKRQENISESEKKYKRQMSMSQESLNGKILEQLRRINFGEAGSNTQNRRTEDHTKYRKSADTGEKFKKGGRRPSYFSERNVQEPMQEEIRIDDEFHPTKSSEVMVNNVYRRYRACSSDRNFSKSSEKSIERNTMSNVQQVNNMGRKTVQDQSQLKVMSNFDRKNPTYFSDRNFLRPTQEFNEQITRTNMRQENNNNQRNVQNHDCSDLIRSNVASGGKNPAYFSDKNLLKRYPTSSQETADNGETMRSDVNKNLMFANSNFDRNNPAEMNFYQKPTAEFSMSKNQTKRTHRQANANFNRSKPTFLTKNSFE